MTTPLTLTPAELKAMPRSRAIVEADGQTTTYEGVLVAELLKRAGAPVGPTLRGDAIATYIVARAKDGYQAVFSIAELDPVFTGSEIMVADTADGKPLFEYQARSGSCARRTPVGRGRSGCWSASMLSASRSREVGLRSPRRGTGRWITGALGVAAALGAAFGSRVGMVAQAPVAYVWQLPSRFPRPSVPADNPMSEAKVALGRHLFYDTRLSANGTQSCATCHEQARAFTDGRARSVGSMGEVHPRGSMSLVNVAYAAVLTWANPTITKLEDQALVPMYGEHPIELGLVSTDVWIEALTREAVYRELFGAAFDPGVGAFSRINAVKAIASFERSIVSARSPYDRYHFERDDNAISPAARRGEVLFHSRPLSCFTCHGGANFSSAMPGDHRDRMDVEFHNTGLYNLPGLLSYPAPSTGIYETTGKREDVGKFKPPTLRNIAVTAPYMHDGSVTTLEEALDHYAAGGRTITHGPNRGIGRDNPNKTGTIRGFSLTVEQRADLIAFLESLTDQELLRDPRFGNPWPVRNRESR